ncbi:capsid protein [Agrobacterium vitis]
MSGTPFPIDPVLTGIIIAYKNNTLIADQVLPRLTPNLPKKKFTWWQFDFGQFITVPDTKVGRKSSPNEVEFQAEEVEDKTEDYGLDDVIPLDDINNAPAGYDPRAFSAQKLIDLVLLDREVRVASKVFNSATYDAANKETLTGTDKWSNAASDPIAQFSQAADNMIIRPNNLVIGRVEWTALRTNANVLKALNISGSDKGMARKEAVADLLELDDIIIGEGWINRAKKGQPVTRQRAWGDKALLIHKAPLASSIDATPTFGWTAQHGDRIAGSIDEPKIGLKGSVRVRSGESVKEIISSRQLGYLFEGVI